MPSLGSSSCSARRSLRHAGLRGRRIRARRALIAFVRETPPSQRSLQVRHRHRARRRKGERHLTKRIIDETAWSPDGRRIAFVHGFQFASARSSQEPVGEAAGPSSAAPVPPGGYEASAA